MKTIPIIVAGMETRPKSCRSNPPDCITKGDTIDPGCSFGSPEIYTGQLVSPPEGMSYSCERSRASKLMQIPGGPLAMTWSNGRVRRLLPQALATVQSRADLGMSVDLADAKRRHEVSFGAMA